jgi:hypothetical protein
MSLLVGTGIARLLISDFGFWIADLKTLNLGQKVTVHGFRGSGLTLMIED